MLDSMSVAQRIRCAMQDTTLWSERTAAVHERRRLLQQLAATDLALDQCEHAAWNAAASDERIETDGEDISAESDHQDNHTTAADAEVSQLVETVIDLETQLGFR